MRKTRILFFVLLGTFGLMAGLTTTSAFAAEKVTKPAKVKAHKVDVNNATEQELEDLPGVGKAYAKKIIDGRPYKTKADLVKAGIPQHTVDEIKNAIKFGKVKSTRAPKKSGSKATSKPTKSDSKTTSKPTKTDTRTETRTDTSHEAAQVPPHRGMVWVNKDTMIYHTEGDRWYGNTKNGEFMTEKDAIKYGARISKQD